MKTPRHLLAAAPVGALVLRLESDDAVGLTAVGGGPDVRS